jgi:pyocin large subunit-like protein
VPFTNGFRTREKLEDHFYDHGHEFGCADEDSYLLIADQFLGGPKGATVLECIRPFDRATVRFDYQSQVLGILTLDNYIRTFFKPDPHEHMRSTNRAYFEWECRRTR